VLDIDEMGLKEIHDLLYKFDYGHLGCALNGQPYIVPIHYYFEDSSLYIFTTIGMKTQYMDANPAVCLQVEEISGLSHWRSVIITGKAERLTVQAEIDQVTQAIKVHNPTFSPALNRTWVDSWGRGSSIVIYRIRVDEMSGRTTDGVSSRSVLSD
jgi:uncharacterized protein